MNYTKAEKVLIWLSNFEGVTPSRYFALLEKFGSAEQIFTAITKRDGFAVKVLGQSFPELFEKADENFINSFIANLNLQGIQCITLESGTYPTRLKELYQPPINLFVKGDISLFETRTLAIVGTRNPTSYGKTITHDFSKALARSGLTIVSGLAMGVDKIAHQACLEVGGKTIAVLGSGFNYIYPSINKNLAMEIEKKGLLVSEYPPQTQPTKFNFPTRNRIVAGLSEGVLLTEAGEKSGTLYTKEYAVENNRNVYVIPGNINSIMSKGTNNLIKNFQGICVLEPKDILDDMGMEFSPVKTGFQLDMTEQLILSFVEKEPIHFEEIINKTRLDPKNLNSYLTTLSIRGIIKKLPGNFYSV